MKECITVVIKGFEQRHGEKIFKLLEKTELSDGIMSIYRSGVVDIEIKDHDNKLLDVILKSLGIEL